MRTTATAAAIDGAHTQRRCCQNRGGSEPHNLLFTTETWRDHRLHTHTRGRAQGHISHRGRADSLPSSDKLALGWLYMCLPHVIIHSTVSMSVCTTKGSCQNKSWKVMEALPSLIRYETDSSGLNFCLPIIPCSVFITSYPVNFQRSDDWWREGNKIVKGE